MSETPNHLEPAEEPVKPEQGLTYAELMMERQTELMEEAGFVVTPVHLSDKEFALMCEGLQTLMDEKNADSSF
jgi:hypothetical protein